MSQVKNGAWSQLGSSSSPRDSSKYFLLEKFSLEPISHRGLDTIWEAFLVSYLKCQHFIQFDVIMPSSDLCTIIGNYD